VRPEAIVVVSGLPRSGTSMMMMMLEAAGVPILTDSVRSADEDNPRGYFEFERVKAIAQDQGWLEEAQGKAVKVISELLMRLPADHHYKVIFMRRDMQEILASQRQMLMRRGQPADEMDDVRLASIFGRHLGRVEQWIAGQPNVECLYVSYNEALARPREHAGRVNEFLGGALDVEAMIAVVDHALHRQRNPRG
jgi:hypothetical protein